MNYMSCIIFMSKGRGMLLIKCRWNGFIGEISLIEKLRLLLIGSIKIGLSLSTTLLGLKSHRKIPMPSSRCSHSEGSISYMIRS